MNDSVIERVAREDPVRREPGGGAWRREQAEITRARVLAAIDRGQAPASRPARRGGSVLRAGGLAAAVVVVAFVAFVALGHHGHAPKSASAAGRARPAVTAPAKPIGLYAAGVVNVGDSPQALLAHGDSLWIATPSNVVRLNLRNGSTIARTPIPTDGVNAGLAFGAGSIWLAPTGTSQLLRINPSSNRLVANIHLGVSDNGRVSSLGGGVASAAGRIWVSRDSNRPRGDVISVNPTTNQASATPITVGSGPDTLVSGFGSLWVDNTSVVVGENAPSQIYPAVSRIDLRTRHVTTEPFSGTPATGFGSLWIQTNAASDNAAIIRVDPATGQTLARIAVPRVVAISSGGGRVWAISYPKSRSPSTFQPIKGTAALWQIDPRTNRVIGKPIHLPLTQPISIVVSDGQLWIADYQSGTVIHFQLINH